MLVAPSEPNNSYPGITIGMCLGRPVFNPCGEVSGSSNAFAVGAELLQGVEEGRSSAPASQGDPLVGLEVPRARFLPNEVFGLGFLVAFCFFDDSVTPRSPGFLRASGSFEPLRPVQKGRLSPPGVYAGTPRANAICGQHNGHLFKCG